MSVDYFSGRIPSKVKYEDTVTDLDKLHSFIFERTSGEQDIYVCNKCNTSHHEYFTKGIKVDLDKLNNVPFEGKFHCNHCSKSFSTDHERRNHVINTHTARRV